MKALLRKAAIAQLPPGYDVDTHFTPRYNPWDQRMCLAPDGDFFAAIRSGRADVVTDQIAEFTETGIRLESGAELEADIVVTATGLRLLALGGMRLTVDGSDVTLPRPWSTRGRCCRACPTSPSPSATRTRPGRSRPTWSASTRSGCCGTWTPTATTSASRPTTTRPWTERPMLDFQSGYVQRAIHEFPKSGSRAPWRVRMNYPYDLLVLRYGRINDGAMRFSRRAAAAAAVRPRRSRQVRLAPQA